MRNMFHPAALTHRNSSQNYSQKNAPPILWGKETYSNHKDVFAGLFGNVGRQAAEPNQNRETEQETPPSLLKNEISPTRLAPTFHEQHKREGRDTVPGNEQKVEDKRGSLDPNALKKTPTRLT
ncbi:hypothetical protein QW131_15315 [Roseibium salinum]|nr:hypothetical protein [Roseibium salinum]